MPPHNPFDDGRAAPNHRKRRRIAALIGAVLLCAVAGRVASRLRKAQEIAPLSDERVLRTANFHGETYKLAADGRLYRVAQAGKRWVYVETVFDPKVAERTYVKDGAAIYRVDESSGQRYRVLQQFSENFEDIATGEAGLRQLIGEARKWTEVTLQTPRTPTVRDYVALRKRILKGTAAFEDARVEPSREQAHGGRQSLKCVCPPKSDSMVCAKASLSTGFIHFVKGEEIWYRAWYRIDGQTRPYTLVDIESDLVSQSPGIRVMLFDGGELGVELKALDKPTFRQPALRRKPFPLNQWVEVTWHIHLDDGAAGRVQLWQDGALLVDAAGPTLPFRTAIYNSLEVGISAHSFGDKAATLFVDDIQLTTRPLR